MLSPLLSSKILTKSSIVGTNIQTCIILNQKSLKSHKRKYGLKSNLETIKVCMYVLYINYENPWMFHHRYGINIGYFSPTGLKVEASSNVFLENLHSTRNLETTYYVTDMTQASDFYWIRESGLQVNIGILNVNVIPEYEDVDHDSDNKYMLGNPNNSEDKKQFSRIVDNYCR